MEKNNIGIYINLCNRKQIVNGIKSGNQTLWNFFCLQIILVAATKFQNHESIQSISN